MTPAQAQLEERGARVALPSGGKFFIGQVLEVMRSDGSWSNVRCPPGSTPLTSSLSLTPHPSPLTAPLTPAPY